MEEMLTTTLPQRPGRRRRLETNDDSNSVETKKHNQTEKPTETTMVSETERENGRKTVEKLR
jgi:hypothetical protein